MRQRKTEPDMLELNHTTAECTGSWRLIGTGVTRRITCDRCNAEHPATADHRLSAIDENYAGIYLRRLTAEGASHLSSDRG
jgi:hypothetical protein